MTTNNGETKNILARERENIITVQESAKNKEILGLHNPYRVSREDSVSDHLL